QRATTGDTVDTGEKSCFRKRLPLCVRRVLRGGEVIVTLVALAVGARLGAQEPVFKGGIRTVAVYATVANADGRLVPDLGRDKFSILDNGKPAELTLFANDVQPITVVLLLDRSGSMRGQFELVEKAAEEFVNVLLPADKARIGSFADRIQVDPRDFTS